MEGAQIALEYLIGRAEEKSIKNCIISLLNSATIDVDGLDYAVRDAYMSGINSYSITYQ